MKTQNQIIRSYHDRLAKMQENIRIHLSYLTNDLPLKASELTRKYAEFLNEKGKILQSNIKTIYLPIVIIAIVGLYVLDQIILSDLYDYMAQFNDKDIPDIYRKIIKFTLPLIILVLYAYSIDGYSKSKEEYEKKRNEYETINDPLLPLPQHFKPKMPLSLRLKAILKYGLPLFIVLAWSASYVQIHNNASNEVKVDLLLKTSLFWIAIISHLFVIFYGEMAINTIKFTIAKVKYNRFWNKRRALENEKAKVESKIADLTNDFTDDYNLFTNRYPIIQVPGQQNPMDIRQYLRIRFTPTEMAILQRISAVNFNVDTAPDTPLFGPWPIATKKNNALKRFDVDGVEFVEVIEDENNENASQQDKGFVPIGNNGLPGQDGNTDRDNGTDTNENSNGFDTNIDDTEKFV